MSIESRKPERSPEAQKESIESERAKEAVDRMVSLIETDSSFDWLMHLYTSKGYEDVHFDHERKSFSSTRDEAYQIPIYSTGDEVRKEEFKFHGKLADDPHAPDHRLLMLWMNLGSTPFADNNPYLRDPRGSYFACALRWEDTPEALSRLQNEDLLGYLNAFSGRGEFPPGHKEFVLKLMEVCNQKGAPGYWEWVKTLER